MAEVTVRTCDQCKEPMAPGQRRFRMQMSLDIINGATVGLEGLVKDICGAQCAHAMLRALIEHVEAEAHNSPSGETTHV